MIPVLDIEATGEQLIRELPERLAGLGKQRLHIVVTPAEETISTTRALTIEEKLLAIALEIPPEERALAPTDLAENP